MGSLLTALSSSTRHISTLEFAKSLHRVLSIGKSHDGKQLSTLGLAISGGVDSMALAVLCSRLKEFLYERHASPYVELQYLQNTKFKAFIVDHQVRSGSYEEARAVSGVLEKQGISSEILKITWPEGQDSSKAPNFESLARKYRFRRLGEACRDRGINSLLLAHHEDDQVETILMRLIAGHRGTGLVGIKEAGGIPECYGMHGVYESGGLDTLSSGDTSQEASIPADQLAIESGGIKIYRPMLAFGKERLIATCKHENMEWFEDQTNKDPTLTKRNAIRHMYQSHAMPTAFSKPALLNLSKKVKDKVLQEDEVVAALLTKGIIKDFNTIAGSVKVQFPGAAGIRAAVGDSNMDCKRIAAKLLCQILSLVSPLESIELRSLDRTVAQIFPGLTDARDLQDSFPRAITVASVYLQQEEKDKLSKHDKKHTKEAGLDNGSTKWQLSRQPFSNSRTLPNILIPFSKIQEWTPWHLFDGRYWIRIQYLSSAHTSISIRPFRESDLRGFKKYLAQGDKRKVNDVPGASARGSIRWTLPAFVAVDLSGKEQVVALPTIGIHPKATSQFVKWEIRYKKVEIPGTVTAES